MLKMIGRKSPKQFGCMQSNCQKFNFENFELCEKCLNNEIIETR